MSRIGRKPIQLPAGVDVRIGSDEIVVKGPKGQLTRDKLSGINVQVDGSVMTVTRANEHRRTRAFHGLQRALLQNMVTGVTTGYERKLSIIGVGYRAEVKGKILEMALGFSHPIQFPIPEGIGIEIDRNNNLTVSGISKVLVGETAARIRRYRPPDAYKGKGVRYTDEYIKLKPGKSASAK